MVFRITKYTGVNYQTVWNNLALGIQITTSAGTLSYQNTSSEIGEIMIFGRILSVSEQLDVENYLKDKWRYNDWTIPITPTPSVTPTITPSRSA